MAMTQCPECGEEVSDKAGVCPNCGCPLMVQKAPKKPSLMVGSIIGLIGGASFTLIMALSLGNFVKAPQEETPDVSVTLGTGAYGYLGDLGAIFCIAATILFIIALVAGQRLTRKAAIGISVAALVLSIASLLGILLYYNVLMFCIGWLLLWEPVLEVIGSVKMLSAAIKYEDA